MFPSKVLTTGEMLIMLIFFRSFRIDPPHPRQSSQKNSMINILSDLATFLKKKDSHDEHD